MIFGHRGSQWGKYRAQQRAESIHQHSLISWPPVGTAVTHPWHPQGQHLIPAGGAQGESKPITGRPGTAGELPAPAAGATTAKSLQGLIPSPSSPQRRDFLQEHQAETCRAATPRDPPRWGMALLPFPFGTATESPAANGDGENGPQHPSAPGAPLPAQHLQAPH